MRVKKIERDRESKKKVRENQTRDRQFIKNLIFFKFQVSKNENRKDSYEYKKITHTTFYFITKKRFFLLANYKNNLNFNLCMV